jgi:hypothetical protein
VDLSIYHSCDTSSREEQAWEETTAVQRWQQPTSSFPSFLPIAIESDRIRRGFTSRLRPGAVGDGRFPEKMAVTSRDALLVSASQCRGCVSLLTLSAESRPAFRVREAGPPNDLVFVISLVSAFSARSFPVDKFCPWPTPSCVGKRQQSRRVRVRENLDYIPTAVVVRVLSKM